MKSLELVRRTAIFTTLLASIFAVTPAFATAPTLTITGNQPVREGVTLNIALSGSDIDPGDKVSFSQTGLPLGFCSLTSNPNDTGSIVCNPAGGDAGTYPVRVTATDDSLLTESTFEDIDIVVTANTPPSLTNIGNQALAEGTSLSIPLSATDADTDGMSFSFTSLPAASFCSVANTSNGVGALNCNPAAGQAGIYNVTIRVTDNGPLPEFAEDGFQLTVTENAAPILTAISNQAVVEGASLSIPLSATDPDGDNNGLSFAFTSVPSAVGFCTLTNGGNGSGSIDCNPIVGNGGAYAFTVTVTDVGPVPASASDPFTLTVGANQPPVASNVSIIGTPALGEILAGSYTYSDAEVDAEGVSIYRWLRDGIAIPGANTVAYTVVVDDIETALRFEVTPVAATGATQGLPVQSVDFQIANVAPSITGQLVIDIPEDSFREIVLTDLIVTDSDSVFPDDFTLTVRDGANYTRSGVNGNTITPILDYDGPLTVPVTVNDKFVDSAIFNLLVTVIPVNDPPVFVGLVQPLITPEDTTLTIVLEDLLVLDPDNVYPADFTLVLTPVIDPNANYTIVGDTSITPTENFNGQLSIPATVSDLEPLASPVFFIIVDVEAVNDVPTPELPIGPQNAIEDSPFDLGVSGNFSDADGDTLSYTVEYKVDELPVLPPPNILFDTVTGVFSGTPRFVDTEAPGPVYQVTVSALDPVGEFVSDTFELTISALGRANLGLSISVTPDTAMPSDDLRWTFTSRNPVGPVAGANVELTGSFVGTGLTVSVEGGANCTIEAEVNQVTPFVCILGALPVGASTSIVITTTTSQASEVVTFATVAGTETIPIDPNLDDNSEFKAAGVADAFSVGAVQILGNSSIRSVAAGDVNGDGKADLVVGTAAGRPVQIYFNDTARDSCQCLRDFLSAPISIPDLGSNEGVALADFDGNGSLDLVVANGGGQVDRVYINDGVGNFAEMTPAPLDASFAQDVAVGDFDNDGDMDIAIAAIGGNPVYLGNGNGGFNLHDTLGNANSVAVAVARFNSGSLDDLVFANVASSSAVWTKNGGAGFTRQDQLNIGDAVSVAAADLNGDNRADLVFGRVPNMVGNNPKNPETPSNPVLINDGSGRFGNPIALLGISPTNDVHIGDVNQDGSPDLVFIGASGVHQIWTASGGGYTLHREQIIDSGAVDGVLIELGDTDTNDPGGVDLAMGGAAQGGLGVYLNDGFGNLGRGDAVPPTLTLLGEASVSIPAKSNYGDAGATAEDNIDGSISAANIRVSGAVNSSVVGNYVLTYNVDDFAGNSATPITRTITVTPASGGGGGGGGTISYFTLLSLLVGLMAMQWYRAIQSTPHLCAERRNKRVV